MLSMHWEGEIRVVRKGEYIVFEGIKELSDRILCLTLLDELLDLLSLFSSLIPLSKRNNPTRLQDAYAIW